MTTVWARPVQGLRPGAGRVPKAPSKTNHETGLGITKYEHFPENKMLFSPGQFQNEKNGFHDKVPLDGRLAWERYMYDNLCVCATTQLLR